MHFSRFCPDVKPEHETDIVEFLAADHEVGSAVLEQIEQVVRAAQGRIAHGRGDFGLYLLIPKDPPQGRATERESRHEEKLASIQGPRRPVAHLH